MDRVPRLPTVAAMTTERSFAPALVAVPLAAGAALAAAVVLWHPGPHDDISYAAFAPVRDSTWIGTLLFLVGLPVAAAALGIAGYLLAPGRRAAAIGAVCATVGGAMFAAGTFALGTIGWYVTATDAIPADSGTALVRYIDGNLGHVAPGLVGGFLLFNIGVLLVAVALWRAGSVPRWLPIALAVLTVAQFAVPAGRVLDVVQAAQLTSFVVIAWSLRETRPSSPR